MIWKFHLVYVYSCHRGVNIWGWKHLMTFTPSTKHCTVCHSPLFAFPQLSPTSCRWPITDFVRWSGILKLPFQSKISEKSLEKHESIKYWTWIIAANIWFDFWNISNKIRPDSWRRYCFDCRIQQSVSSLSEFQFARSWNSSSSASPGFCL